MEFINWFSTRDWPLTIEVFKNIFTIGASIIAGYVALKGLDAWKMQQLGMNDYQLAKNIKIEIIRLVVAINKVRNPFMTAGEIRFALKKYNFNTKLGDKDFDGLSIRAVWMSRLEGLDKIQNELEVLFIESEALWESEVFKNSLSNIDKIITKLKITIDLFSQDKIKGIQTITDTYEKWFKIVYAKKGDDFIKELNSIIDTIFEFINPKIMLIK